MPDHGGPVEQVAMRQALAAWRSGSSVVVELVNVDKRQVMGAIALTPADALAFTTRLSAVAAEVERNGTAAS
jgi:hypothetical protein